MLCCSARKQLVEVGSRGPGDSCTGIFDIACSMTRHMFSDRSITRRLELVCSFNCPSNTSALAYFQSSTIPLPLHAVPAFGWLAISAVYGMIYLHRLNLCGGLLDAKEKSSLSTGYSLQNGDKIGDRQDLRIRERV